MNEGMKQREDSELWRAAKEDPEAFGELFVRHAPAIYNYCFRRTADWALAEDLTSVVFLEAWRRRDAPVAPDKVLPWLLGIATNVVRHRWRSMRRHRATMERLPRTEAVPNFAEDVLARLDDEQRMQEVLSAVKLLPRRDQEVLALCAWQELSYEDAAFALGIPVGTVRSRLHRARERLAEPARRSGHGAIEERAVER
jgi:RNA polymerase sigma factor (sigma-70 family)